MGNEVTIKDFRCYEYTENKIVLNDRRKISELLEEIQRERDFTVTFLDENDEWQTIMLLGPIVNTRVKTGDIEIGGKVTEEEKDESEEDWE